jgi:hypothetical protein
MGNKPQDVRIYNANISVADPGCLSRIPDPKTATKDWGEKFFFVKPFFVAKISQN